MAGDNEYLGSFPMNVPVYHWHNGWVVADPPHQVCSAQELGGLIAACRHPEVIEQGNVRGRWFFNICLRCFSVLSMPGSKV